MATVDQELLFAIRGIEVLLESGVGVAEAMKHVADEDYGDLSEIFKQIFRDTGSIKDMIVMITWWFRILEEIKIKRIMIVIVLIMVYKRFANKGRLMI